MKTVAFSVVLLNAVLTALAAPRTGSSDCKLKESIAHPQGWVKQSTPVPAEHPITLRIGLQQSNFAQLEQHLVEVSDPGHWRYGDHLSKDEVEELVAPHPESLDAVDAWLASHGISDDQMERSPAKDWVTLTVPVGLAETMLDTKYNVWTHAESGESVVRTTYYGLPESVFSHIELVQPTTLFARTQAHRATTVWGTGLPHNPSAGSSPVTSSTSGLYVDPSCNNTITPGCLKQLYNATGYTPSAKSNVFGITGYLDQYINNADLESFYAKYVPAAVNSTYKTISINGGQNSQNISLAGDEANLDSQYGYGISYPTKRVFFTTGGSPPYNPDLMTPTDTNEPYQKFLNYALKQDNLPQTISTSYGDDEQTVPESYALRVCRDFAQLGARGVSVIFSSGDYGVGDADPDPSTTKCKSNNGKNETVFLPVFPASCPYVTSVGATIGIAPEVAVDIPGIGFYSGGGFSNYFARPWYQESAVDAYLSKLPKGVYSGLYNASGRGYPDVAAQGWNFSIYYEGELGLIGGTSAAAPTFASLVSNLNDARINAHQKPLGFLNPLLYSTGVNGLKDITSGNNPGCGTEGWNATVGWDPVTGLGTLNFGKMKDIVLNQGW